jgi:predicted aspartyl protease
MPAVLNGKKVKCLVDTGSSTTIIRPCVAKTLGLSVKEDIGRPVLRGFSGNRVASTGTVNIHVRVGEASARLRVVVVNDDQLMHDCIIGADFLNLSDVLLVKVEDKVSVRYNNQYGKFRKDQLSTISNQVHH